jgi:hypothetical protein
MSDPQGQNCSPEITLLDPDAVKSRGIFHSGIVGDLGKNSQLAASRERLVSMRVCHRHMKLSALLAPWPLFFSHAESMSKGLSQARSQPEDASATQTRSIFS